VGDVEIVHTPGRAGDFAGAPVSGERAAAELGWHAATPFAEGVRRYVDWHRAAEAPAAAAARRPDYGALARRAALGLGWAAAIAIMILGVVTLAPVGRGERYSTFLDTLLLMLPLVLAGGFSWDDHTASPLRAALWVGGFGCLALGVAPWPPLLDHLADSHRVILVLLALSTASAARMVGRRPLLAQWLGAPGE
jgi:hypothetical protein